MSYMLNCFPWAWSQCRTFVLRRDRHATADATQPHESNGTADFHESPDNTEENQPLLSETDRQSSDCGTFATQLLVAVPSEDQPEGSQLTKPASVPHLWVNPKDVERNANGEAARGKHNDGGSSVVRDAPPPEGGQARQNAHEVDDLVPHDSLPKEDQLGTGERTSADDSVIQDGNGDGSSSARDPPLKGNHDRSIAEDGSVRQDPDNSGIPIPNDAPPKEDDLIANSKMPISIGDAVLQGGNDAGLSTPQGPPSEEQHDGGIVLTPDGDIVLRPESNERVPVPPNLSPEGDNSGEFERTADDDIVLENGADCEHTPQSPPLAGDGSSGALLKSDEYIGEEASTSQAPCNRDEDEAQRGRQLAQSELAFIVNPPTRNNTMKNTFDVKDLAMLETERPPRHSTGAIISTGSVDGVNGLDIPPSTKSQSHSGQTERTDMSPSSLVSTGSRRQRRMRDIDENDAPNFATRSAGAQFDCQPEDIYDDSEDYLDPTPQPWENFPLDELIEAQLIEWPKDEHRFFIPTDAQKRLVTRRSIKSELVRIHRKEGTMPSEDELEDKAWEVRNCASKLFAILVCLGKQRCIYNFLKEGLKDKDLPFVPFVPTEESVAASGPRSFKFKLSSRRMPEKPIASMINWSRHDIIGFSRDQWSMLAPVFKEARDSKVRHMELQELRVLPYIEDHERDSAVSGGFGAVWAVRIHPAHQRLLKSTNPKNPNPLVAIKRLISREENDFRLEVEMLKAFSNHKNPHLIRLLATYRLKGQYHLMFPHCKFNLRTYWEETPQPEFTSTNVRWFLSQCKGIAHGLQAIHDYRTSLPGKSRELIANIVRYSRYGSNLGVDPVVVEKGEQIYGRHGDIKPENILWSDEHEPDEEFSVDKDLQQLGLLLIADFGLMDFHGKKSRSLVPADMPASPTYAPPELVLKKNISREYDIWSLGCVYLEFITWLVARLEDFNHFADARGLTGASGDINDDCFYTIIGEKDSPSSAIVRESVTEWMKDLHEKPRCSQFIHDFLDLISQDMLVIDQHKRIQCGLLNARLYEMCRKGIKDSGYLVDPKPRPPRNPKSSSETTDKISRSDHSKNQDASPPAPEIAHGNALPRKDSIPVDLDTTTKYLKSPRTRAFEAPLRPMSPSPQLTSPIGMIRPGSPHPIVTVTPVDQGEHRLVTGSTSPAPAKAGDDSHITRDLVGDNR